MAALVNSNARVTRQGFTGSQRTAHCEYAISADTLSDTAHKIVKAVQG
jgi:hypothetical protein